MKALLGILAVTGALVAASAVPASAREFHHYYHGWGGPRAVFVGPRVVVAPPPVYYAPPPVYYAPRPVVVAPSALNIVVPLRVR